LLTALLLLLPTTSAASAQSEYSIEGSFVRIGAGYARQVRQDVYLGGELVFGGPVLSVTLHPSESAPGDPEFDEFIHLAFFTRLVPSERAEVDLGVRASLANLWPCPASDCLPQPFFGVYVQPMVGWRRFKVGTRFLAGRIGETRQDNAGHTGVFALVPFVARLTFPR
jgi:hypothetical protein